MSCCGVRLCLLACAVGLLLVGACSRQPAPPSVEPAARRASSTPVASSRPEQVPPEGASAQILNYDLQAEILPAKHYLKATVRVDWEVRKPSERLEFRLRPNLVVKSLTGPDGQALQYDRDKQGAMSVRLSQRLEAGAKPTLTLEYEGEIYGPRGGSKGQRLWDYIGKEGTYVRFEAEWYPQVSGDTATADLQITAPDDWMVVSCGELVNVDEQTWHWRVAFPAVGLSFTAAPYTLTESTAGRVPLRCYTFAAHAPRAREFLDKCGQMIEFYEQLYGPYPFPKFAIAEIPDLYGGGHGDQSFIMLQEKTFREPFDDEFVAHELAHNWWGSLLFCTESEFPLEGFATYSQALWREHKGGKQALREAMKKQAEAVLLASLDPAHEKSCFASDSGPLLYEKGSWILHMSRRLLGEEAWFRAVRKFAVDNAGRVFTVAQLRQALEAGYGHNLTKFFQQWVYGTGVPWVKGAVVSSGGGKAKVRLTQAFVSGEGNADSGETWKTSPSRFELPVDLLIRHTGGETRKSVWLTEASQDFEIALPGKPTGLIVDPDEWLLDHSKGLAGELDQERQDLQKELEKEIEEELKDVAG